MAEYTYLATDLRTGEVLQDLPLTGVSYSRRLNGGGTFSASLPLSAQVGKDVWSACTPARVRMWVLRNGFPVGEYIIWTRKWNSGAPAAELRGSDSWSYFTRREIVRPMTWTSVDTAIIAGDVLRAAQSDVGGDIGVAVPTGVTAGVLASRDIYSGEHRRVADEVEDLTRLGRGFTFDLRPTVDSAGNRSVIWTVNPQGSTTHCAQYPGNALEMELVDDASAMGTALTVVGGGSADTLQTITGRTTFMDAITDGYPLLDSTMSAPVSTLAGMQEFLAGVASVRARGVQYGDVKVRADDPAVGSYNPGDRVRLIADGGPVSLDRTRTLVGYTVTVGSQGSAENVTWETTDSVGSGA